MFAIEALTSVGRIEDAKPSIIYLRSIWSINSQGNIVLDVDDLPTKEDFEKINERMKEEDEGVLVSSSKINWTRAEDIDIAKMHKNWLLGVLLTAEAAFDRTSPQLKQLIKCTLAESSSNGSYYPERVPWVTARILLGLSSAGVTSAYSPEVRKTVDWLLKENNKGGAMTNSIWQSGTGTWNSELEVSAMCTLALVRCGVDPADHRLDIVKRLIKSTKFSWSNPSTILDGALAAEAFLAIGEGWDEVADEVKQISLWTRSESFWKSALKRSRETFSQSCRVAQIASNLINIGWLAVRSDLPSLVNAFAVPKTTFQPSIAIATSQTSEDIQPQRFAKILGESNLHDLYSLQKISLLSLSVVGSYRRYNERTRNRLKDWCLRIENPHKKKSLIHENFLIWAPPGSGKTFLIQELSKSVAGIVNYSELNLAATSKEDFQGKLMALSANIKPCICLIDEIDARSEEIWPYEEIFPYLDLNLQEKNKIVFVLIGSSRNGIEGLASFIETRPKGKDLLDRVPNDHRFIIPALDDMDKTVLFITHVIEAAKTRGSSIDNVEKLALYFIISNEQLRTPRQIRDLAHAAVQRIPSGESRLRYSDIFDRSDKTVHKFWIEHEQIADSFSELFVTIEP